MVGAGWDTKEGVNRGPVRIDGSDAGGGDNGEAAPLGLEFSPGALEEGGLAGAGAASKEKVAAALAQDREGGFDYGVVGSVRGSHTAGISVVT